MGAYSTTRVLWFVNVRFVERKTAELRYAYGVRLRRLADLSGVRLLPFHRGRTLSVTVTMVPRDGPTRLILTGCRTPVGTLVYPWQIRAK